MGFGFIKTEIIQPTQLGFSLILAGVWQNIYTKEKNRQRIKQEEISQIMSLVRANVFVNIYAHWSMVICVSFRKISRYLSKYSKCPKSHVFHFQENI